MDKNIAQNPPQEPVSYTRPGNSSPKFFDKFFSFFTKKTVAGLVILVLIIGIGAATIAVQRSTETRQRAAGSSSPCPPLGDVNVVNGDGVVNALDELILKQYDGGLLPDGPLKTWVSQHGDVNQDGTVNAKDVLFVAQYEAELISTFPACIISGTVFLDNNNTHLFDGQPDYPETATIKLENGTTATKYLNGYFFTYVPSGNHTVTLTVPPGYTATTPTSISVTAIGTFRFGIKTTTSFNYSLSNTGNQSVGSGYVRNLGTINATLVSGTTQPVSLSVSGVPAGASFSLSKNSCSPGCFSFMAINTGTAAPGTYPITITGSPLSKTTSFNLTIASGSTPTPTGSQGNPTATPTPTRTPTPTPNLSITPTPTGTAGGTQLALSIGLDAIGSTGDNNTPNDSSGSTKPPILKHTSRNVKVEVFDTQDRPVTNKSGTIAYQASSGKFTGNIDMGNLASGNYTVKVKSDGYLRKLIPGIHQNVTSGQTYNLPAVNLVTGNINGNINDDNSINILDYNILISCLSDPTQTVDNHALCNTPNTQYAVSSDLDDNGVVDQSDYNLFRRELSVQNGD